MANMSYCRFENTYQDLDECVIALEEQEELSHREERYARKMRELCEQYISLYDELYGGE